MPQIQWNDEAKMAWCRVNIDPAEKSVCLAISREYVLERDRNVSPVYKFNKQGEATHIALASVQSCLDEFGNYAKRQKPVQFVTQWYRWESAFSLPERLAVEWEMWIDAYGFYRAKDRQAPEYDTLTQHRIGQQENAK
jgi:hypothetical protein